MKEPIIVEVDGEGQKSRDSIIFPKTFVKHGENL